MTIIAHYVEADKPQAAIRILEALHEAFRTLAASPEIGNLREDLMPNLRMFSPKRPASNYIIFYYVLLGGALKSRTSSTALVIG